MCRTVLCNVRKFCGGNYRPDPAHLEGGYWVAPRTGGYATLRPGNLFVKDRCVWRLGWEFQGKRRNRCAKIVRVGLHGLPATNSKAFDAALSRLRSKQGMKG